MVVPAPPPSPEEVRHTLAYMAKNCPNCNLAGADLKGVDLATANLAGANLAGADLSRANLRRANRRAVRTVYRPDPWRWPEHATVASGLLAAVVYAAVASLDPTAMLPATSPLAWPELPLLPLMATLLAAAPAWVTPPVPRDVLSAAPRPEPGLSAVAA